MKLIIELKERGRVIGLKRSIGRLIEWFCTVLGDEIVLAIEVFLAMSTVGGLRRVS
jgi:hypothetical protein